MEKIENILVAYDGSPSAKKAFLFALDFTNKYNAKMTVLSVVHFPESTSDIDVNTVLEIEKAKIGQLFQTLKERAAIAKVEPEFVIKVGKPGEQIISYTLDNKIDHIFMGHENHRLLTKLLVGSVAKHVIDNAACGITVIP
jgi:nucleotide-binding universal stress UspA family protein